MRWARLALTSKGAPQPLAYTLDQALTARAEPEQREAIHRIADPLQASLIAPDGVIEGTELRPEHAGLLPWYASVQFHPERLDRKHPEHALLFRAFVETCTRFQK